MKNRQKLVPANQEQCKPGVTAASPSPLPADLLSSTLAAALTEIGFEALFCHRLTEARVIFDTLHAFRPTRDFPVIGLVLIALTERDHDAAMELLRRGEHIVPNSANLQALLALTLLLSERYHESAQITQRIRANDVSPAVFRFAEVLQKELECKISPASCAWPNFLQQISATSDGCKRGGMG